MYNVNFATRVLTKFPVIGAGSSWWPERKTYWQLVKHKACVRASACIRQILEDKNVPTTLNTRANSTKVDMARFLSPCKHSYSGAHWIYMRGPNARFIIYIYIWCCYDVVSKNSRDGSQSLVARQATGINVFQLARASALCHIAPRIEIEWRFSTNSLGSVP